MVELTHRSTGIVAHAPNDRAAAALVAAGWRIAEKAPAPKQRRRTAPKQEPKGD